MQVQNVRISFPQIFNASSFHEGDKKKFSATFIMDEDHPQMEALAELVVGKNAIKLSPLIPVSPL